MARFIRQSGKLWGVALLLLASWQVSALGLTITQSQMQAAMTPFFPYPVQLGSWHVVVDDPRLNFFQQDQSIALDVRLDIKEGARQVKVDGRLKGQLKFDARSQQLQLVQPELTKADIRDGDMPEAESALERIKAMFGKKIPVIVLFDIKQMGLNIPFFSPSAIRVVDNGVAVDF